MKHRVLVTGIALTLIVMGCLAFVPLSKICEDGTLPLTVTIRSAAASNIRAVSAEAFGNSKDAEYVLENTVPPETKRYSASQARFTGQNLTIDVPIGYTTRGALLWHFSRYYQFTKLVVLVEYVDGKRTGRLVDIPDLHHSQEIPVEVP